MLVLSRQRNELIIIGGSLEETPPLLQELEESLKRADVTLHPVIRQRLLNALRTTIEIAVVDIRGDKVWLGINAPREVSVHREEVYRAIQREYSRANPPPKK